MRTAVILTMAVLMSSCALYGAPADRVRYVQPLDAVVLMWLYPRGRCKMPVVCRVDECPCLSQPIR